MLNLDFHPATGDIARITNENAIKSALKNLIMTDVGELPYQPDYGSNVKQVLFDLISPQTVNLCQQLIKTAIENHEALRVQLVNVTVNVMPEENAYAVTIQYRPLNSSDIQTVNLILKRVR